MNANVILQNATGKPFGYIQIVVLGSVADESLWLCSWVCMSNRVKHLVGTCCQSKALQTNNFLRRNYLVQSIRRKCGARWVEISNCISHACETQMSRTSVEGVTRIFPLHVCCDTVLFCGGALMARSCLWYVGNITQQQFSLIYEIKPHRLEKIIRQVIMGRITSFHLKIAAAESCGFLFTY